MHMYTAQMRTFFPHAHRRTTFPLDTPQQQRDAAPLAMEGYFKFKMFISILPTRTEPRAAGEGKV